MSRRTFFDVVVRAVAIIGLWVGLSATPPCSAQGVDAAEKGLARALQVQERHTNDLMGKNGVVGTAVGLDARGQHVVKVYVAAAQDAAGIAKQLDGVPVAVQVSGVVFALKPPSGKGPPGGGGKIDPTARFDRPVPIGVSTGHPATTAGTIGCRVTDDTNVYALSNNHVYANENGASIGDAVIQPGTFDGGTSPADDIGTLFDFEPIDFEGGNNVFDAAIASTTTDLLGKATPSNGYGTPRSATTVASVGMKVLKYGRTTSQTEGRVDGINATFDVLYSTGVARFVGQIVITPGGFSAGGDSGSLIVVTDKKGKKVGPDHLKPVGLLFAGSAFHTIANPIEAVLIRFGVTVDGM